MTAILKVDTIQDTSGNNIINENANTITIGKSGDTVNLAAGATNNLGITEADQWRITADFSVNADTDTLINSNWERIDTSSFGYIGTGMTESSGIFTFPSTGIYLIHHQSTATVTSGGTRYWEIEIYVSTNGGSNFTRATKSTSSIPNIANALSTGSTQILLDVTSTSLIKVQFRTQGDENYSLRGNTSYTRTASTFIKLGDT